MADTPAAPEAGLTLRRGACYAGLGAVLAVALYLRNPAIALLGTLVLRLALDVNPVPQSGRIGKLSLQTAIVLLGFTLGIDRVVDVSADYGVTVAIFVLGTLALGAGFALVLKAWTKEAVLLSGGTAICGGTAIATLAPVIGARSQEFAIATALVFLLNAVALFTFPTIGHWLALSQETFGAWVALAIHDTSSVVATAALYGTEAAEVATTVKLGRTLWLIPLAFAASVVFRQGEAKIRVPAFVIFFVLAAGLSSLLALPDNLNAMLSLVSKGLLVLALAMIGLDINRETVRGLKLKSMVFGVGLWLLIAPLSLVLVMWS